MDQALIDSFIAAVEHRMRRALGGEGGEPAGTTSSPPGRHEHGAVLAEASRHLCLGLGGKRFRPKLVLQLGAAAGVDPMALEDLAVVAEFIHGASLLHDDVVDEGQLRRGRPTVNANWGNLVAVLAGDWLLSSAFALLKPFARPITTEAIDVVGEMSRAAIAEVEARGRVELPLEDWRAIAIGKTGSLFAWCGRAVALLANRPDLLGPFDQFGRCLGVAFQLGDDLKDLIGGAIGKDRFSDVRNANPSFPLLLAMQRSPALRMQIATAWTNPPLERAQADELGRGVLGSGAADAAAEALHSEVSAAVAALGELGRTDWCAELLHGAVEFGEVKELGKLRS